MSRIVAFSGAGISAESGITTFQDRPDIRTKLTRTFANEKPLEYRQVIEDLQAIVGKAKPNAAHLALAENNIEVVTMNIDGLHHRAGSTDVIEVHGRLPDIVLYEDAAPKYQTAIELVLGMQAGDILLVIGASWHTQFAVDIRYIAQSNDVKIVEIQQNAATEVPKFLAKHYQR